MRYNVLTVQLTDMYFIICQTLDRYLGVGVADRSKFWYSTSIIRTGGDIFRGLQIQDQKREKQSGFWASKKPFYGKYVENG